jgi:hypothetical protein
MLALVGTGIASIPWPTMLSVIAQIVAGEAQQRRRGTARILQQARAADRAVHGPCAVPWINLDWVFVSGVPGPSARDACERGCVSVVALGQGWPGTGDCAVSTVDFLNG